MAATAALKGFIDTQNLGPGLQVFLKEAGRKSAVNWVRIAIFQLGGPERAAARLGVKLPEVHGWLKNGVRGLPYRDVERLAFASRIPMSLLEGAALGRAKRDCRLAQVLSNRAVSGAERPPKHLAGFYAITLSHEDRACRALRPGILRVPLQRTFRAV